MIELTLPFPPSVNSYWRSKAIFGRGGVCVYVAKEGKSYRSLVEKIVMIKRPERFGKEKVRVEIDMYPPDNRRRDVDNILKALLDALENASLYDDDNQICSLSVDKKEVIEKGKVVVRISSIGSM